MIDLKGYRVLITASSKGIGFGIAKVLSSWGASVVINGRNMERLKEAVEQLREINEKVFGIKADITIQEEAEKLVDEAARLLDGLDALVYVTGPPKPGYFKELSIQDWEYGVKLLIMSAIWITRKALNYLLRSRNPSITYLTSIAVKEPIPNIALSNTLRISIHGLVKTLSRELGPLGIRVNAILPGYIYTDRLEQLIRDRMRREKRSKEEILSEITSTIPLRRIGKPEEIGYLVGFLISPYASYITGASIPVDGGRARSVF